MKITKSELRRIIKEEKARLLKESMSDEAYEAGYNDAMRDRPHGTNPDMRDLDPRSYDHGFDKGTADRMDMQRPSGTRGFYEGDVNENFGSQMDDAIDEAQELIYYALRSAEDDIDRRGIQLAPGEFAMAVERAVRRFR